MKAIGVLVQLTIVLVMTVALTEGMIALSFRYPRVSPIPVRLLRYLHLRFDRNVIQVMPECAVYDARVTYTLKPGRCVFANREFRTEYRVNSLGVRDDETSLTQPELVVLGDSLAMGWGVEEEEAFPALLERATGMKTLNAGVSSYGTVRELRLLERVDRSALKMVILQYNDNDALENSQFVEHPPFTTLSAERYRQTIEDQQRQLRYLPGKYSFNIAVQLQSAIRQRAAGRVEPAEMDAQKQAALFLAVLEKSPVDLSLCRLVVMSVNTQFVEAAHAGARASAAPWMRRVEFLDISAVARVDGAYYVLDDHPTSVGQRAIAEMLITYLGRPR